MENRHCVFISGLCQSRKTQKTLDVIAELVNHDNNGATLLLYITQAGSTLNAFQVIQRLRSHPRLGGAFPCVVRSSTKQDGQRGEVNKAVVDFYHKKNTNAMLRCANERAWSHIICIIDEADQGASAGFLGRLNVLHQIDQAAGHGTTLHAVFVTATVPNLCRLFIMEATKSANAFVGGFVHALITSADGPNSADGAQGLQALQQAPPQVQVRHVFVTPHETYVSMNWFYTNRRVSIVPVAKLVELPAVKKHMAKNGTVAEIQKLAALQRRLILLSFTNSKDEQSSLAETLVAKGEIDIAVCLNSENNKNYIVYYANGRANSAGVWSIPYGSILRCADKGRFARHVNDLGGIVETGLDRAHDISLSHVLFAGMLTNEDFAHDSSRVNPDVRPQLISLRNYMTDKRPADYPKGRHARMMIIGGNMLSRGITIQDPNIGFTCTAFVFMDSGSASPSDAGASHTQKAGRALGNMLEFFEGGGISENIQPQMVISSHLFVSALSNERLTYKKGVLNDGALIDMKTYVTSEEYRATVKLVKREIAQNAAS